MSYATVTFNKIEKKFLAGYCPEDDMFTSLQEIKDITAALNLDNKSCSELTAIRNSVVEYYGNRMEMAGDSKEGRQETMSRWMPAMQSVTVVIDNIKIRKYGSF